MFGGLAKIRKVDWLGAVLNLPILRRSRTEFLGVKPIRLEKGICGNLFSISSFALDHLQYFTYWGFG